MRDRDDERAESRYVSAALFAAMIATAAVCFLLAEKATHRPVMRCTTIGNAIAITCDVAERRP